MNNIQIYLDALYFIVKHTDILMGFGLTLAVSIALGALFLDRFVLWLWVLIFLLFLGLTQYQINNALKILEYNPYQIVPPRMITIISSIIFIAGSGLGYFIKVKRQQQLQSLKSADDEAKEIVTKVNGGDTETVDSNTLISN